MIFRCGGCRRTFGSARMAEGHPCLSRSFVLGVEFPGGATFWASPADAAVLADDPELAAALLALLTVGEHEGAVRLFCERARGRVTLERRSLERRGLL